MNMKVTFLGTNGWYDTQTGNTTSVLIETDERYIVLDAGFGFYKVKDLPDKGKPISLFLSHFHLDHIIGLHTLPLFNFPQGLDIYLPKGGEKILRAFLKRPLSTPPLLLKTKVRFHDITKKMRFPFEFEWLRLQHSVPCYGYRFGINGTVAAYCTDTGLCGNLKRLARGADLLMLECAMKPGDRSPNLFHVTPETAAKVAHEAGSKRLALFHFDAGKYPTFGHRDQAEASAKAIFRDTIATRDGTVITL